jgi:hypothetical protein
MVLTGKKSSRAVIIDNGYLFCNHCGDITNSKNDESLVILLNVECGNPLEFCKTRKSWIKTSYNLNHNKKALNQFEARILERRKNLLNIFLKFKWMMIS